MWGDESLTSDKNHPPHIIKKAIIQSIRVRNVHDESLEKCARRNMIVIVTHICGHR